jgi:small-conductance mechanosensitive channel
MGGNLMVGSKYTYMAVSLVVVSAIIAVLVIPFINSSLSIYVSVLAIAFSLALQKYLASFAGFFVIKSSNIFDTGDRIRIGSVKGDVKHIGLFHVILDEVGEDEKMGGELTGRIVHVPNLVVLDQPVLNFSKDYSIKEKLISCGYIFDEIRLPLKQGSDVRKAADILEELLRAENGAIMKQAKAAFTDGLPNFVQDLENGPRITVHIEEKVTWIKGRFVTSITDRNVVKTRITMAFLERIKGDPEIGIGEK